MSTEQPYINDEESRRRAVHARIANDFTYHPPQPKQVEHFDSIRAMARSFAHQIAAIVPVGREQATALTKLEEAVMWANAGIARETPG